MVHRHSALGVGLRHWIVFRGAHPACSVAPEAEKCTTLFLFPEPRGYTPIMYTPLEQSFDYVVSSNPQ